MMTSTMNDESSQVEPTQTSSSSLVDPDQIAHKRKLSDSDPSAIPNKIAANEAGPDAANNNNSTPDNVNNEDDFSLVEELDEAAKKRLLEQTTEQLKKSLCIKKLKQLGDVRDTCVEGLSEQYFLENNLNYLNYEKWKRSGEQHDENKLDFIDKGFGNKDEIYNIEKFISVKFNAPLPLLEQTNKHSLMQAWVIIEKNLISICIIVIFF